MTKSDGTTRVLVITTASALQQWQEEYERWLNLPCTVCSGTKARRERLIKEEWQNGMIISLDSLKQTARSEGMVPQILKQKPQLLILDEAHRIRNTKSASAKSVLKLARRVPNKLALTGTPAPGRAYDIFGILQFLYPRTFTSAWKFKREYFREDRQEIWTGGSLRTFSEFNEFLPGKERDLQLLLSYISVRRTRAEVMPWLPDKDYQRVALPLTKIQEHALDTLHKEFRIGKLETVGVLDTLIRERQLCLDPQIVGVVGKSPKTEWLKQYLQDYEEPVLIFSKFTTYLKLLFNELSKKYKLAMIIGDTPQAKRHKYKTDFQAGKFNILLLNIDAGKEALTLDRAETAIFMDKYPPIGDILQAEDRFVATTQDKQNKPHKIIELMMKDSFDETVYDLLRSRMTETDIINNYHHYLKGGSNAK